MKSRSPFPGMDPYLENPDIWSGFHTPFFVELMTGLNEILPPNYQAKVDRYLWIHEPEAKERILLGNPDVYVAETERQAAPARTTTIAAPETVVLPAIRREGNRYIKVIDRARDRVVTVLELLSPSNKTRGPDRDAYLMKPNEYLAAGLNVIELDLLRSGERMPWGDKSPTTADYDITVCRKWEFPKAGVWPISVRDSLPDIPIPLEPEIEEPMLALQHCFDEAYRKGRFGNEIDYGQPPAPPLQEAEAPWAKERIDEWRGAQGGCANSE